MDYEMANLVIGIVFTFTIYSSIPLYLRFIKKKKYANPHKLCLKISIIVAVIDFFICVWYDYDVNLTPPFLYYFINYQILKAPKYLITVCKLCGKETIKNEYDTCEDCHKKVLEKLAHKEIEAEIEKSKAYFCSHCGTKLEDKASFCYNCGNKIKE